MIQYLETRSQSFKKKSQVYYVTRIFKSYVTVILNRSLIQAKHACPVPSPPLHLLASLCSQPLTFIFRIFHSLLPPSAANEQESPADSATLTFDLSFSQSAVLGRSPSTEMHRGTDNCTQVSVRVIILLMLEQKGCGDEGRRKHKFQNTAWNWIWSLGMPFLPLGQRTNCIAPPCLWRDLVQVERGMSLPCTRLIFKWRP